MIHPLKQENSNDIPPFKRQYQMKHSLEYQIILSLSNSDEVSYANTWTLFVNKTLCVWVVEEYQTYIGSRWTSNSTKEF